MESKRIQDIDIKTLEKLIKRTDICQNICIVFTKADCNEIGTSTIADKYKEEINCYFPDVNCFSVCNKKELNEKFFDMAKLIEWSKKQV